MAARARAARRILLWLAAACSAARTGSSRVEEWEHARPAEARLHGLVAKRAVPDPAAARGAACYWVSDEYKFIGVKLAKAGGSSIIKFLKSALCGLTFDGPFSLDAQCADQRLLDHGQDQRSDCQHNMPPPEKWREYFVFAFVRNPYSRRVSMVRYCHIAKGDWCAACAASAGCGRCSRIHCAPAHGALLGGDSGGGGGGGGGSVGGHGNTTASALDFVGHVEDLGRDLEAVLHEVQRRAKRPIAWRNATPATELEHVNESGAGALWRRLVHGLRVALGLAPPEETKVDYMGAGGERCARACEAHVQEDYGADATAFGYAAPSVAVPAAYARAAGRGLELWGALALAVALLVLCVGALLGRRRRRAVLAAPARTGGPASRRTAREAREAEQQNLLGGGGAANAAACTAAAAEEGAHARGAGEAAGDDEERAAGASVEESSRCSNSSD